jgi:HTH-type transcriptional regulator/antitoxin HipB
MQKTLRSPRHVRLIQLIVDKRREAGMSQADLAEALDRYQSVVAAIESGGRRIDVVEFLELAEVIGFDPHEVLRDVVQITHKHKTPRKQP